MRMPELYKYNPRQCPPQELQDTFVARRALLDGILDDLRANASASANQHFLITGARGIGKTNLLLMIRYAVQDDDALAKAYLPIQTAEEEYSVASLRDLFAKVLALLIEAAPDDGLAAARESVRNARNDDEAAELGIAAVKDCARRSGQKVLLLMDNLDLVLGEQLSDDAELGRLRDLLMNDSFVVLIGAAPSHFQEVSGYDRPFYNFFRTIDLQELTAEQMTELLRKRAELDGNQTILGHVDELQPRIRAVHHLTGGNPRLVLMLYQLCTASDLPDVRTAVQSLLDDVTPYYKARLEQLAPQPRRVMDTFARLGRPATPAELARETRLGSNQINSILQRLKDLGFVTIGPQERRKKTYYMVSERMFRIWHQMRFSTATHRRLEFLVEFIRIWYTAQEWSAETKRLLGEYGKFAGEQAFDTAGRYVEHLQYMADAAPTPEDGYAVQDATIRSCIESGDLDHAEALLNEKKHAHAQDGNHEELARAWFLTGYLRSRQGRRQDEMAALSQAVSLRPRYPEALYAWGTSLGRMGQTKKGAGKEDLLRQAVEKLSGAIDIDPGKHAQMNNLGLFLIELAGMKSGTEREEFLVGAIKQFRAAVRIKSDKHEALNNWGLALGHLAGTKTGVGQDALYEDASGKVAEAIRAAGEQGADDFVRFYSAHFVHIAFLRCAGAVEQGNAGDGRGIFAAALERIPQAREDLVRQELVSFFGGLAREATGGICAEFLDAMRSRGMEEELEVLEPFVKAVEYWQKGKDPEVLDRLNPEVRQIVEEIIGRR